MRTVKHLFIPDLQVKPGNSIDHIKWIGQYIMDKRPDVIVCIGDFWDMPSLSSYDKGKKAFEGRRYKADVEAGNIAMKILLAPMNEYNERRRSHRHSTYSPRMIFTVGNHEERIMRACNDAPEFDGILGYHDLCLGDWEVHDFLNTVVVDGVCYTHYLANPMTGKPYGGTALSQLAKVGQSFVVGHKQTLDVATRFTLDGRQQWGIIAGAAYLHDEDYKGPQGNHHWRGVVMLHEVSNGSFNPMFVSMGYLKGKYGTSEV